MTLTVDQKRTACARLGLQAWTIGDELFVDGKLPTEKAMADEWAKHEFEVANPPKSEVEILRERVAELEVEEGQLKDLLADVIEELLSD